jgi:PAS domain S-box-containing protein
MSGIYNPLLVFVSFIVAFLASYTAVELSSRISSLPQARRRTSWLFGGAIAMGIGIWSMHFIGMLAFALPIPVGYDLSTTAASLLLAVVVSFLALITVTRGKLSGARLGAAGTLMGLGIAGMHYTGMAAMQMSPPIRYTLWIVVASVAIAIAASIAALWIAFTLRTPEQQSLVVKRLGSAMIMGLAITGMHYTGMGAANFEAGSICLAANKLDANWLALLVSTSSLTVLIGTLVFLGFNTSSLSNSLRRANDRLRQRGAELERAIQSLRDSQQLLQSIVDNAGTPIYVKHLSGRYLLVNRRYEELFHATLEDILDKTDYDLFTKEHADAYRAVDERVATGEVVEAEEAVALGDGLHTYISVKFPVRDSADQIVAVGGISTDITERKKNERAVRDSEERTRLIVDSALDAVITINPEGSIIGWNPQASATFGWTADEALGRPMRDMIIPPRLREAHARGLRRYLATGEAVVLQKRIELSALHRDGREFPVELTITPIGTGERLCFSAFLRDITERKEAERAMSESEQRFRATFEQAAVGIAHVSPDGRWLRVNQRLCDIVGYSRGELLSVNFQDITHPDDLHNDLALVRQMLDGEIKTYTAEKRYLSKGGAQVWINLTVALVRDEAGQPDYFISVVEDIERRKAAEEAVQRLNADLERRVDERTAELQGANRELDSFTYAVSHDLRAPLRAMSGFSRALLEDYGERLDGEARAYLDQIMMASRNMGLLVDGLLQLSRSTRGELQRDDVDLTAIVHTVRAELERQEPSRTVAWHIEPGLRAWGDARTLAAVMRNLLENAWKYTGRNARANIRVYVERCGGEYWICVSDNGAGFDMKHADKLFKPFQRLHRQDEFPGIGIGLSTVQRIIHRHGGEIRAESKPNQGTVFAFTLPRVGSEQEVSSCA